VNSSIVALPGIFPSDAFSSRFLRPIFPISSSRLVSSRLFLNLYFQTSHLVSSLSFPPFRFFSFRSLSLSKFSSFSFILFFFFLSFFFRRTPSHSLPTRDAFILRIGSEWKRSWSLHFVRNTDLCPPAAAVFALSATILWRRGCKPLQVLYLRADTGRPQTPRGLEAFGLRNASVLSHGFDVTVLLTAEHGI
jgi:hypothetical protein